LFVNVRRYKVSNGSSRGGRTKVHFHTNQFLNNISHCLLVGHHGNRVLQEIIHIIVLAGKQGFQALMQVGRLVGRQLVGKDFLPSRIVLFCRHGVIQRRLNGSMKAKKRKLNLGR
jgi:hypothetical protein